MYNYQNSNVKCQYIYYIQYIKTHVIKNWVDMSLCLIGGFATECVTCYATL